MAGIPPLQFTIRALHDTGSDALTVYDRDMANLDPMNLYARGPVQEFETANGCINLETLIVELRLLSPDGLVPIGDWFLERAVIYPDNPVLNPFTGQPVLDAQGRAMYTDTRLTGSEYKRSFFCATGPFDTRLILSTNKHGITMNVRAR